MQTGTKVLLGILGAAGLYVLLAPKTAYAAGPGTPGPGQPGGPPAPGQPAPGALPEPSTFPAPASDYAALYVGSEPLSGDPTQTFALHQIATIARRAASNDGMLVHLVNKLYQPKPGEVIYVATTDQAGAILHTLTFNAGLVPQPAMNQAYTVVGFPLTSPALKQGIYHNLQGVTTAKTSKFDPDLVIFPLETNGSGDGAVQRARAQYLIQQTADLAAAAIYAADGTLDVDPDTGNDFLIARTA